MNFENNWKGFIIINPLMRGGIVPEEVHRKLCDERWIEIGYSVCFECLEGRSSLVANPPVREFLEEIAKFYNGDSAEHTFGCRAAQFLVMRTISEVVKEGEFTNTIITDPNSHYTTNIAAEMNGLNIAEPSHSGYPEYRISPDSFVAKIDEIKKNSGKLPALVVVTHADPYYGNIAPVEEVGKICSEYEIPFMVNAAYTGGVMPIDMKKMKADFLTVSAHKSMASLGPLGYIVTTFEWSKKAFATSKQKAEWTGRFFGKKIPNLFGCSVGGIPLISSMLSFDHVKERVKRWDSELAKINKFVDEMENLGDIMLLGENPHRHHLLHFETPLFYEISKKDKRKGFFLAKEMENRGITGLHKGLSKHVKLSIYDLNEEQVKKVRDAFYEIAGKL